MTAQSPATSAGPPTNRRRWVILLVLAGAQMLVQLDATIINTALPAIKRAFEMSESQSLWVADAYMVIFGGLLLLAGALGDRFGRRKTLIIGMGIFVAASIAVAFSPDANFLIVGRGLQGLGGALVIPQTLSILTAVFPREERSRAIGIWAGAMGFGMAFGPLVGGVLVDLIGWAGVFWVPAPIAALAMLGMAAVPESRSQLHTKLDVPGAITGTIAMVAIVFAIIEGIQKGWTDSLIVGSFAVAIVAAVLFIIIERRTDQPLLPMAFFKQRDFTGSMVGMFFIMFALMGVMFYIPQFFQLVQGMSATESGARLMPLALMMMFFAPVAARLLPVLGPRFMLFWAPAVHGAGALLIFSFVLDIDTPYWMIALGLAFLGMGGAGGAGRRWRCVYAPTRVLT
ncbi:MAG: MFS transporter, partial [Chloroflexi bacterium]|nr:MFS transporter [Chloroflexota bacterium]